MWCRELKAAAEAKTNGAPDAELQALFCDLSADVDVLQADIIRLQAEAEGIACANPRVVREAACCAATTVTAAFTHCVSNKPWSFQICLHINSSSSSAVFAAPCYSA